MLLPPRAKRFRGRRSRLPSPPHGNLNEVLPRAICEHGTIPGRRLPHCYRTLQPIRFAFVRAERGRSRMYSQLTSGASHSLATPRAVGLSRGEPSARAGSSWARAPRALPARECAVHSRHGRHGPRARLDVARRHSRRAALRLLEVLEACHPISTTVAAAWRRRITGWRSVSTRSSRAS